MNVLDCSTSASPKSLAAHKRRSDRKLQVSRARHAGIELSRIDREERETMRDWSALPSIQDAAERVDARLKLHKVLDGLRERRRILLGEPLPGSRRAGSERRPVLPMHSIDVQPTISLPALTEGTIAHTEDNDNCANQNANAESDNLDVQPTLPESPSPQQ